MNKPETVVIRRATLADWPTVVRFNAALASETEQRILKGAPIRRSDAAARGWYAVAERSLEMARPLVIGQILVTFEWSDWRNGYFWWLQSLYVHPDHRQQGVFRQLYDYVLAQAQLNGEAVCGLRLYVEEHNHQAQKAYATLGFQKTIYHMYEKALL